MSIWTCPACTARYAVGLAACPQCGTPSTQGGDVPKITREGGPSYGEDRDPGAAAEHVHPGTGEPADGIEHPADGTMSPAVSNEPGPAAVPDPPAPKAAPKPAPRPSPEP